MVGLRRLSSGDLEPLEFTTGDTGSQSDLPRHHVGLPDPKVISPPCGLAWVLTRCPVFMRRAIWKKGTLVAVLPEFPPPAGRGWIAQRPARRDALGVL
jgi:hypothetical protein